MDLGVDLAGAASVAEHATESAVALSHAVEDAVTSARELAGTTDGAPAIAAMIHSIADDWGSELRGVVGQAADSAQKLRDGVLAFAELDGELAEEASTRTPVPLGAANSHGRIPR